MRKGGFNRTPTSSVPQFPSMENESVGSLDRKTLSVAARGGGPCGTWYLVGAEAPVPASPRAP